MSSDHQAQALELPQPNGLLRLSFSRLLTPEILLLLVAVIWGSSYAVAKQVTLQVTVLQYLVLRFGLTAVLLTPALFPVLSATQLRNGLLRGLGLGCVLFSIFLCETWGVTLTSATHAAFLISLCMAFTPLVEWAVLGQRPRGRVFLAVVVSLVGAALLSPEVLLMGPLSNMGDRLMLLAALLRAFVVTGTRYLSQNAPVPALALTALQSWVVFLGALVALTFLPPGVTAFQWPMDLQFWALLLFLVLGCTVLAFFAQNYAASRTTPTQVSFLMGSEPVFGALFGWTVFDDKLAIHAWLGCGLILLATYAVVWWPAADSQKSHASPCRDVAP